MNKKAIAILGAIFLLILLTLGFIVYSRYTGDSDKQDTVNTNPGATTTPGDVVVIPPTDENPSNSQPNDPQGLLTRRLTEDFVISPSLFFDGTGLSYFTDQGSLYKLNLTEQGGQLSGERKRVVEIEQKTGVVRVLWPKVGSDFIVEMENAGKKTWSFFNHLTATYTDLPQQITWVDWMPTGDKIMYVWLQDGKATLNIANPDTSDWQEITELWEQDDAIHVSPDGRNVAFYRTGNATFTNKLTLVSVDGKVWQDVSKEGYNYGVLWSPDGSRLLFGKQEASSQRYQLWMYDVYSGQAQNLSVFTTPEKAVWNKQGTALYVAVPVIGTAGARQLTQDTFYRLDPVNMQKQEFKPQNPTDGRDLFLDKDEKRLLFRNAQDGGLYYLDVQ